MQPANNQGKNCTATSHRPYSLVVIMRTGIRDEFAACNGSRSWTSRSRVRLFLVLFMLYGRPFPCSRVGGIVRLGALGWGTAFTKPFWLACNEFGCVFSRTGIGLAVLVGRVARCFVSSGVRLILLLRHGIGTAGHAYRTLASTVYCERCCEASLCQFYHAVQLC